jgi:hypothetical protein
MFISLIFWTFGLTISSLLLIVTIVQITSFGHKLKWHYDNLSLMKWAMSQFLSHILKRNIIYIVKIKNIANYPAYNMIAYLDPTTRVALPNFELSKSMIGVL